MLVGVMSDSHDNVPNIRRAVEFFKKEGAAVLIHAGDIVAPFAAKEVMKFPGQVVAVYGNNDGEKRGLKMVIADIKEPPRRLELGGMKWLIVHDRAKVEEGDLRGADILVYGHDHISMLEEGQPIALNPGECGAWLTGKATVALVDTETNKAEIRGLE